MQEGTPVALRQETVTSKQGFVAYPSLLGPVFEILAKFVNGNPDPAQVADFVSGIRSELEQQPVDQRKVLRTGRENNTPFPGVSIGIYSIVGEGQYMVQIYDPTQDNRQTERRVADTLGLLSVVLAMNVEFTLPVSGGTFWCDMATVVDKLYDKGFVLISPDLSVETGTYMPSGVEIAQAVGALLPRLPQDGSDSSGALSQWFPAWEFRAGELQAMVTLLAGRPPTVKKGVVSHYYTVQGSVVTGELYESNDEDPERPLLLITFKRIEPPNALGLQMLCTAELCAQVDQAAHAFANLDMS